MKLFSKMKMSTKVLLITLLVIIIVGAGLGLWAWKTGKFASSADTLPVASEDTTMTIPLKLEEKILVGPSIQAYNAAGTTQDYVGAISDSLPYDASKDTTGIKGTLSGRWIWYRASHPDLPANATNITIKAIATDQPGSAKSTISAGLNNACSANNFSPCVADGIINPGGYTTTLEKWKNNKLYIGIQVPKPDTIYVAPTLISKPPLLKIAHLDLSLTYQQTFYAKVVDEEGNGVSGLKVSISSYTGDQSYLDNKISSATGEIDFNVMSGVGYNVFLTLPISSQVEPYNNGNYSISPRVFTFNQDSTVTSFDQNYPATSPSNRQSFKISKLFGSIEVQIKVKSQVDPEFTAGNIALSLSKNEVGGPNEVASGRTDQNGILKFKNIRNGSYKLRGAEGLFKDANANFCYYTDQVFSTIDIVKGEDIALDVPVHQREFFKGKITNSASQPLEQAEVALYHYVDQELVLYSDKYKWLTDEQGNYFSECSIYSASNIYVLKIDKEGYNPVETTTIFNPHGTNTNDFKMTVTN